MRTIKRRLASLSLILAGCIVALVLAEAFVRVFYPYARDHVIPSGLFEIDSHLGWKLAAQKRAHHRTRYFDVAYHTNSLGYRDETRNRSKAQGVYRTLLYGDSQVFGWGIPDHQRFSNLVDDKDGSLEIWNMAVPGYGLDQQVLCYEKNGRDVDADEVIFFVSKATLHRIRYDYIYKKYKPKFIIDHSGSLAVVQPPELANAWRSLLYKVLSPFYLPYFIDRRLAVLRNDPGKPAKTQGQGAGRNRVILGELEQKIIKRALNVTRERKHRMTIMTTSEQESQVDLKRLCDQDDIGFLKIDLDDQPHDLIFGQHDPHWNPQAHVLIADQLRDHLENKIDEMKFH